MGYISPQAEWLQEPDAGPAQHPSFLPTRGPPAQGTERVAGGRDPGRQQFEARRKNCARTARPREEMGKNVSPARSCSYRCCPDDLMLFTGEQSSKAGLRFLPVEWKKTTPKPQHKCAVSPHSSERGEQRWRAQGLPPSRAKEGKSYGEPPTTFNKGPEQRRALLNASAMSFAFI